MIMIKNDEAPLLDSEEQRNDATVAALMQCHYNWTGQRLVTVIQLIFTADDTYVCTEGCMHKRHNHFTLSNIIEDQLT